jgi:tyrosyl-tRNA synthetase
MLFEEKLELIRRNTVEMVTEEELVNVLKTKEQPVVYCGYEPNGPVHLGHFVTMIKLMDFDRAGFKVKLLLADIHAFLNRKGNEEELSRDVQIWRRTVKAIGLNADVILGSSFEFEREYQLEVMRLARGCTINRTLRSMQEIARDITHATISQTWYPLMQVIEIKYLGVDVAEGGLEQRKIHMLGRDSVEITKHAFVAVHTPLIASLKGPGEKMSKSIPDSGISVTDTCEDIQKALKNAYCPERVIKENPVLEIMRLISFPRMGSGLSSGETSPCNKSGF